jgi:hypothetical protein
LNINFILLLNILFSDYIWINVRYNHSLQSRAKIMRLLIFRFISVITPPPPPPIQCWKTKFDLTIYLCIAIFARDCRWSTNSFFHLAAQNFKIKARYNAGFLVYRYSYNVHKKIWAASQRDLAKMLVSFWGHIRSQVLTLTIIFWIVCHIV